MASAMTARPSRLTFATCLFAAPLLFGAAIWLLGSGGDYLRRFAQVGALGMIISLPVWFSVFAWLAWRAVKRGETETRHFVFASLGANIASLLIYPAVIGLAVVTGEYRRAVDSVPEGTELPPEPVQAALFAAGAAFVMGLFFLPVLAALFGWIAGLLRMRKS